MNASVSKNVLLGSKAPAFDLFDPASEEKRALADLKGQSGTLVIFMCNSCPFVKHSIDKLVELDEDYGKKGIRFVGINVRSGEGEDKLAMLNFMEEKNIGFPYLTDEDQKTAQAYQAECTPDFFLYDGDLKLVYHGQMDESRPKNHMQATGEDLIIAFENLLANQPQEEVQIPSSGSKIGA